MAISKMLNGILTKIAVNDDAVFSVDIKRQKRYLKHFKEPKDDIQRSYYQYKCQMFLVSSIWIRIMMNIASFPLIIYYLVKRNCSIIECDKYYAVFFSDGKPNSIIPASVCNGVEVKTLEIKFEYIDITVIRQFMKIAIRYPLSWQFLLKVLIKLKYYCYVIKKYDPKAIITCNEYSFTSSILTTYCEMLGIEHINVMHGEKLYFIRDSFFRYSKCYVWDEYYKKLLCDLRADSQQFVVEIPPSLKIYGASLEENGDSQKYDYTYYLASENKEAIGRIVDNIKTLQELKKTVKVRPHPRYTTPETVSRLLNEGIVVEDIKSTSIEVSLRSTSYAVALYSTVLNQAYNNGIGAIIDDLSEPQKYLKLKERRYRFIKDESVKKLSDIIRSFQEKNVYV